MKTLEEIRKEFERLHFDFSGGEPIGTKEIADWWIERILQDRKEREDKILARLDRMILDSEDDKVVGLLDEIGSFIQSL